MDLLKFNIHDFKEIISIIFASHILNAVRFFHTENKFFTDIFIFLITALIKCPFKNILTTARISPLSISNQASVSISFLQCHLLKFIFMLINAFYQISCWHVLSYIDQTITTCTVKYIYTFVIFIVIFIDILLFISWRKYEKLLRNIHCTGLWISMFVIK